jgi:hypothetical protein
VIRARAFRLIACHQNAQAGTTTQRSGLVDTWVNRPLVSAVEICKDACIAGGIRRRPSQTSKMNSHTPGFLIWAYVPSESGMTWEVPYVCQPPIGDVDGDVFYAAEDAHRVARILRQHYPGHLFAVVHTSRLPKVVRPELPSFV